MALFRKTTEMDARRWKVCLECGNRFQSRPHGLRARFCSVRCEEDALRRSRDEVDATWVRARWVIH